MNRKEPIASELKKGGTKIVRIGDIDISWWYDNTSFIVKMEDTKTMVGLLKSTKHHIVSLNYFRQFQRYAELKKEMLRDHGVKISFEPRNTMFEVTK